MSKVAVLVDGAFYLKRAKNLKGERTPARRAEELARYCADHATHLGSEILRIYYYDCDPIAKKAYHPLLGRTIDQSKSDEFAWKNAFFDELSRKRSVAIRKGETLEGSCEYVLKKSVAKSIVQGKTSPADLTEDDFVLDVFQKGVDVRIGLDIALLSQERYVEKIVLITGDSDFVPAAKFARRHGVDFVIDPMWADFRPSLGVHVDGMYTPWPNPKRAKREAQ